MQDVLACIDANGVSDCSGCLMGHSDVLLVLLSPRSFSERFGARARPVHPILSISASAPANADSTDFLMCVLSSSPRYVVPRTSGVTASVMLTFARELVPLRPQNSFGPGRSCLEVQVIRVAAAIMRAIPAMLMTTCIAKALENSDRITKPINDSKTPRQ